MLVILYIILLNIANIKENNEFCELKENISINFYFQIYKGYIFLSISNVCPEAPRISNLSQIDK